MMKRHSQIVSAELMSPGCAQERISSKILDLPPMEQSRKSRGGSCFERNYVSSVFKGDMADAGMFYF